MSVFPPRGTVNLNVEFWAVYRQSGNFHYKTGFSAKIEHAYSRQEVNEYGEGSVQARHRRRRNRLDP